MRLRKRLRYIYYRAMRNHGKPREIAMGAAIGMAVGLTPTLGHIPAAIAIAALTGQSKLAAALGVWVNNPLTLPFILGGSYVIGAFILGYPLVPPRGFFETFTDLSSFTSGVFLPLWVGSLVLVVPVGAAGYWLTYQAVVAYRLKTRERRAERMHRWHWNEELGWHRVSLPHAREASRD